MSIYTYSKLLFLPLSKIKPCIVRLKSFSNNIIPVEGKVIIFCNFQNKKVPIEFYITSLNQRTIIGLKTSENMGLIKKMFDVSQSSYYDSILNKYKHVFEGTGLLPGEYKINIDPNAPSHIDPPRRQPFKLRDKFKNELEVMLKENVIEEVNEPCKFLSSVVCVEKSNNRLRICLDPRFLNKYILRSKLNIPTLETLTSELNGSKYFSVFDAKTGFWNLKLDEESSKLTAFNTEFGVYRFLRMPYGISVASEIFQDALQRLLSQIPGLTVYIDDILIHGRTKAEHDERLLSFLKRAEEIGLKLNKEKVQIGQSKVKFMGQILTPDGMSPNHSQVEAINNMLAPNNIKELQRFLGVVNYLGKYIKNLSDITSNLRTLLKKETAWHWNANHDSEFQNLKKMISQAPVLTFYDPHKEITLSVDASSQSLGAVILHGNNPIAYSSKSLNDSQKRYSQIEKELLAIVYGCAKFDRYLYGQKVIVHTDHKPLVSIFNKSLADIPQRLQRMMLKLQSYDLKLVHVPGKHMYIADTLSRASIKDNNLSDETDSILNSLDENVRIHANFLVKQINVRY